MNVTGQEDRAVSFQGGVTPPDESELVEALRRGDEAAFATLLDKYHASLLRMAMIHVSDRAVAEEVVQETWVGVLEGIHRFEGRSSLKTWLFRILFNCARTRAVREGRSITFSRLGDFAGEPSEPAVEPDRFLPADHPQWANHWSAPPRQWGMSGASAERGNPEALLMASETRARINEAIATLPHAQQMIITLRDVNGFTAEEACNVLGISESNQRVLLHRARSRVRRLLEEYFERE